MASTPRRWRTRSARRARSGPSSRRRGPPTCSRNPSPAIRSAIPVPTRALDQLAAELGWRDIDFLKMDAEGHEPQIVEGGKAFFARESPLVMLEVSNDGRQAAAEQLRALGYAPYRLLPGPGLLVPVAAGEALDPFLINLFCCKPDRARRLAEEGLLAATPAPAAAPDVIALHRAALDRARGASARCIARSRCPRPLHRLRCPR